MLFRLLILSITILSAGALRAAVTCSELKLRPALDVRLTKVTPGMAAQKVVALLGNPEFHKAGERFQDENFIVTEEREHCSEYAIVRVIFENQRVASLEIADRGRSVSITKQAYSALQIGTPVSDVFDSLGTPGRQAEASDGGWTAAYVISRNEANEPIAGHFVLLSFDCHGRLSGKQHYTR